jgi:hypothetical protein
MVQPNKLLDIGGNKISSAYLEGKDTDSRCSADESVSVVEEKACDAGPSAAYGRRTLMRSSTLVTF